MLRDTAQPDANRDGMFLDTLLTICVDELKEQQRMRGLLDDDFGLRGQIIEAITVALALEERRMRLEQDNGRSAL